MKSTQKPPNCKKRCGPCKKRQHEKVVKSKMAAQKWPWWSDNGKIFNSNNSGEFWCRFPIGGGNTNSPELLLLKILPLSDHHDHFWAATFDFTTFLHVLHFFTVWLFLCRFNYKSVFKDECTTEYKSNLVKLAKCFWCLSLRLMTLTSLPPISY